ncbi:RelA/SpoT family protein [Candidatus Parcubacteria bacterium]|nr:RelA/SpoT family protein [Patescibacteria group bacterium]MCG2694306.1 RelA/SpoT family protein [Candidatus Parcubacteria bacterium]
MQINLQNNLYKDLVYTIKKHHPKADLDLLELAYEFADDAHRGQLRASGEPYINHPLHTALTLAKMKLNMPIVIAAILHDVPEDTSRTLSEIEDNFGEDIASMVGGITKLGKIKYRGMERYIENLRKMFISMASDIRVVFIKFADRLHNLKTLNVLSPKKQYRIALETLEIYAPIANRLGMGEIKGQLEDLAFKYVYPKEFSWAYSLIQESYNKKKINLEKSINEANGFLKKDGVNPIAIHGRRKHIYSLYKKILEKDRNIDKVYDIIAVRIIVKNISDCYAALGIIHKYWKPLKGRIKDYIAQPKPNGYRSLHTTVFTNSGDIVEVQIRTEEMHDKAEFGIASHWVYDEAGKKSVIGKELYWMQELAKVQKNLDNKKEFLEGLESLKIDVFKSRIFVFTPKGDVIDLPEDATPIDFAYAIHSDIGDKCTGSVINDQIQSLNTSLKSGDVIHIITNKDRRGPSGDWLKIVKTRNARQKIRAYLNTKKSNWLGKIGLKK